MLALHSYNESRKFSAPVYWITGLSGAGKTSIARELQRELRQRYVNAVLLDGDELRGTLGDSLGYSAKDRRYLADFYARLSKLISGQGTTVICATVSMFHSVRAWNRNNIADYREVFVQAPSDELQANRAHYTAAPAEESVTIGTGYELPRNPDLVLDNDRSLTPAQLAARILHAFDKTTTEMDHS